MNDQSPQVSRVQYSSHVSNGMKLLARPVRQMEQYLPAIVFCSALVWTASSITSKFLFADVFASVHRASLMLL